MAKSPQESSLFLEASGPPSVKQKSWMDKVVQGFKTSLILAEETCVPTKLYGEWKKVQFFWLFCMNSQTILVNITVSLLHLLSDGTAHRLTSRGCGDAEMEQRGSSVFVHTRCPHVA